MIDMGYNCYISDIFSYHMITLFVCWPGTFCALFQHFFLLILYFFFLCTRRFYTQALYRVNKNKAIRKVPKHFGTPWYLHELLMFMIVAGIVQDVAKPAPPAAVLLCRDTQVSGKSSDSICIVTEASLEDAYAPALRPTECILLHHASRKPIPTDCPYPHPDHRRFLR